MRQRLVGALVLLCGGVILWSLLFTGPAAYRVDRRTQIPPAPDLPAVPAVEPEKPADLPPPPPAPVVAEDVPPQEPPAAAPAPAEPKAPALEKDTALPEAWVVQVAAFGQRENAEKLKSALQEKNYKAYIQKAKGKKGDLYRVMVGPLISQEQALKDKAAIEKAFNLKTILAKFER